MKLVVLQNEHFSCHGCTNCCRDWHVELSAEEVARIEGFNWPNRAEFPKQLLFPHGGKTVIAHRADGSCIFLNLENGRCRIHEQFGAEAKPLGCRLFPFQIAPTFAGEASVIARFNCPTVRKNEGASHEQELGALRKLAGRMELTGHFDDATLRGFSREQVEAVVEFLITLMPAFARDEQRALFISYLADWLATLEPGQLSRETLGEVFGELKQAVELATSVQLKRPGRLARTAFRTLLSLYLRRDEDVLNQKASRIGRTFSMLAVVLGFGRFDRLGVHHPKGKLRNARLFKHRIEPASTTETFALYWRMVRNRLESFQFMGQANHGRDLVSGLRSLAMTYPLVLAAAKYRARNRSAGSIEHEDVEYAVAAIEHSFGRSAVLNQPFVERIEALLQEPMMFARVVRWV